MFANSVIVEKRSCLSEIAPDVILQIFLNKMIVWSDIVESKKSLSQRNRPLSVASKS
jgi:hypothetical protein